MKNNIAITHCGRPRRLHAPSRQAGARRGLYRPRQCIDREQANRKNHRQRLRQHPTPRNHSRRRPDNNICPRRFLHHSHQLQLNQWFVHPLRHIAPHDRRTHDRNGLRQHGCRKPSAPHHPPNQLSRLRKRLHHQAQHRWYPLHNPAQIAPSASSHDRVNKC